MAIQLTDNLKIVGGYVDKLMTVETLSELSGLTTSDRFTGLTVTVKNFIGKIPADFWLTGGKTSKYWKLKNVQPLTDIELLKDIPETYFVDGFPIYLTNGERYVFGPDSEGKKGWRKDNGVSKEELNSIKETAVSEAVEKITDGASENYDTLKKVETWITEHKDAKGDKGDQGEKGEDGKSAYQIAVDEGFDGDETAWLESLKGAKGDKGDAFTYADFTPEQIEGLKGPQGERGEQGLQGEKGEAFTYADFTSEQLAALKGEKGNAGENGKSAYEIAKEKDSSIGTEEDWLASLKGKQGEKGEQGEKGIEGKSAFDLAKESNPELANTTLDEWLSSLKGEQGPQGPQGEKGNAFTYSDFTKEELEALKGPKGDKGDKGEDGKSVNLKKRKAECSIVDSDAYVDEVDHHLYILREGSGESGTFEDLGEFAIVGPKGEKGDKGEAGANGKSAYQIAVDGGFDGDETAWLESLKGAKGDKGDAFTYDDFTPEQLENLKGPQGIQGEQGPQGDQGDKGNDGENGKSAFELAQSTGFTGTMAEWLESLHGKADVYSGGTGIDIAEGVISLNEKKVKELAADELARQLIPSGASESMDTLQEIAAWIQSHPDDASKMNANIKAISGDVETIKQNYAKTSDVNTKLESYVTKDDLSKENYLKEIPSEYTNKIEGISVNGSAVTIDTGTKIATINGLATEAWVNEIGYATKKELDEVKELAGVGDANKIEIVKVNGTELTIGNNKDVNIDLSGYVTNEQLTSKNYLTEIPANYENKIESIKINGNTAPISADKSVEISIPSVEGFVKEDWVTGQGYAKSSEIENDYLKKADAETTYQKAGSYVTVDELDAKNYLTEIPASYTNKIEQIKVDGTPLVIGEDKSVEISLADYAKSSDVESTYQKKGDYALKSDVVTYIQGNNVEIQDNKISVPTSGIEAIATTVLTKALIPENAKESMDTLQEIAAWIQTHPDDATAMNKSIESLETSNETISKKVENLESSQISEGIGTEVTGEHKLNVKVAESTETNKNYLKISDANELEVKEIGTDATKTSKDIVVEGGAWADQVKGVYGGTVPAGTTLQDFLTKMLCVEKEATSVKIDRTFTVSCAEPTNTISITGETVENGTKISLGEVSGTKTTASQTLKVTGMTYGYKVGENGAYKTGSTYTETLTPILSGEEKQTLKETFTGFVDAANGGKAIASQTGEGTLPAITLYVSPGNNTLEISQTGSTYNASTAVTAGTIYIASNLKNYNNTIVPSYPTEVRTAKVSKKYTFNGANKYFIGDIKDYSANYWDEDRSAVVRSLGTRDWAVDASITVAHTFSTGTKQQTVVVPSNYTIVSGKDVNNGDVLFGKVKTIDFTNAQGYTRQYNVFVAPATDGLGADSKITITIK